MSKADILQQLPELNAEDRAEILDRLWELAERDILNGVGPTAAERALLDRELEDYRQNPEAGSKWSDVELRLRSIK
jgi:hypothetical protein